MMSFVPDILAVEPDASFVTVDAAGNASTSIVVRNHDSVPHRCTLRIIAIPAEIGLWFTIEDSTRELAPGTAGTFSVHVSPLDDRVGEFPFFALAYDADQPDDISARSDVLKLVVTQTGGVSDTPAVAWSITGERHLVEIVLSTGEVPTFIFTATAPPGSAGYVEAVLLSQQVQDEELGTFGPPEGLSSLTVDEPRRRFGTGPEQFVVHVVSTMPAYWPFLLTMQATLYDGTGFPAATAEAVSEAVDVEVYEDVITGD
jgi:hypothetical protein